MATLFGAQTGMGTDNFQSGSPEYQNAIFRQAEQRLAPQYRRAQEQTRQTMSNRGILDSGIGAGAELGLREAYLSQLGDIATGAATRGADLTEQKRQRAESRAWQVEDRNVLEDRLRRQAEAEENRANQQMWSGLISGAAQAGGTALGGPLAGWLFGQGSNAATQAMQPQPVIDPYDALGIDPYDAYMMQQAQG